MKYVVFEGHFYLREYQISRHSELGHKIQLHKYKDQFTSKYCLKSPRDNSSLSFLLPFLPCSPPPIVACYLQKTGQVSSVFLVLLKIISFQYPAQLFSCLTPRESQYICISVVPLLCNSDGELLMLTVSCSCSMQFSLSQIAYDLCYVPQAMVPSYVVKHQSRCGCAGIFQM